MKLISRICILAMAVSPLTSCLIPLPRNMSRHIYTTPASADGKMCFNQCMSKRNLCINSAKRILDSKKHGSCAITTLNKRGSQYVEAPTDYAYWSGSKTPENCTFYSPELTCGQFNVSGTQYASSDSCDNYFNNCISQCGGSYKVETKTICWGAVE